MPITALYAGLLAFVFVVLSFRTIGARRAARVEIGDGSDRELLRRMRVHANFAEYGPIALILLALAETMKTNALLLHGMGLMLLVGRLVHAYALSQTPHILPLRVAGMVATLTAIMAAAITCLTLAGPSLY